MRRSWCGSDFVCFVSQDDRTTLILASQNGRLEVVKALLDAGANMEAKDRVSTCGHGVGAHLR